jgi:hypothetical protein
MPRLFRLLLLNAARHIAEREGLTMGDIRNVAGADYIVDKDGTFYQIASKPKENRENKNYDLRVIK